MAPRAEPFLRTTRSRSRPRPSRRRRGELRAALGKDVEVLITDINDLGGHVLGSTMGKARTCTMERVLRDNPLGQGHESTPLGIIREP